MKTETVFVFRPEAGPPVVCSNIEESMALGITGKGVEMPVATAVAQSVGEHHDWKEKARVKARMYIAGETGNARSRFVLDPAPSDTVKIPKSVKLPPEMGGESVDVICAHDGPCVCERKHSTRWLDVRDGMMVTACSQTKKVYWVRRAPEGESHG